MIHEIINNIHAESFWWGGALVFVFLGIIFAIVVFLWKQKLSARFEALSATQSLRLQEAEAQRILAIHELELRLERDNSKIIHLEQVLQEKHDKITKLEVFRSAYLEAKTKLKGKEQQLLSERGLLDEMKVKLLKEFEYSADKIFNAKTSQFEQHGKQSFETALTPFKDQLKDFNKRVEHVYHQENNQRNQLVGQIAELQKQALKIGDDANNLAKALKGDNKLQGAWGELVLERLLEQCGLQKGREYKIQKSLANESGKRYRPDVIVHLPDGKDVVIDSKVSLLAYDRYCACEPEEKSLHLKAHTESLRSHVKLLAAKKYEQLEGINTLDFVFVFIPIDAAYSLAAEFSEDLIKDAFDNNIVFVSPSSLMVALRTVESLWRSDKQNKNAEIIAASAGKLYDQFVLLLESLEETGRAMRRSEAAFQTSLKRLSSGRGNLIGRVEKLKFLGAKVSKDISGNVLASEELRDELDEGELADIELLSEH